MKTSFGKWTWLEVVQKRIEQRATVVALRLLLDIPKGCYLLTEQLPKFSAEGASKTSGHILFKVVVKV
jgi:hypothetical protein